MEKKEKEITTTSALSYEVNGSGYCLLWGLYACVCALNCEEKHKVLLLNISIIRYT